MVAERIQIAGMHLLWKLIKLQARRIALYDLLFAGGCLQAIWVLRLH